jgi:hypothetical protein
MPSNRDLRVMAFVGVLVVALTAAQTVTGLDIGLLHLAPALVLLLPLVAGRYVGEERLAALGAEYRARPQRAAAQPAPHSPPRTLVRGGRLIAAGLVERGPPSALAIAR